jgi:hypothetical protein
MADIPFHPEHHDCSLLNYQGLNTEKAECIMIAMFWKSPSIC